MPYGNLLADVVQSSTTGTPPQFNDGNGTQTGTLCRAWVNFAGVTTVTIRASFNVSSVVRTATGNYTVNFTNALSDANYAVSTCGSRDDGGFTGQQLTAMRADIAPTASVVYVVSSNSINGTYQDFTRFCVSIFR